MKSIKRFVAVLLSATLLVSSLVFSVSAAEDFTMDTLDKGYVTLVFDDGKMPITEQAAEIFEEFDMPMSAAVPAKLVEYDNELYNVLLKIQDNGGEILSHGYNHIPIVDTTHPNYANMTNNFGSNYIDTSNENAIERLEYELGESWRKFNDLGINVNGMIEVGCGGAEGSADYELVESIARKYYKYSNASGVSSQYKITRRSTSWDTMANLKGRIYNAGKNKTWVVLYAHSFSEISSDSGTTDGSSLREVLQYVKDLNGAVEIVTYSDMYEKFGNYTGDAVPTEEAIATLDPVIENDYYVQSPGYTAVSATDYESASKGSGTKEDPAHTVADLIKIINSDGLNSNDTANVYIMQDITWNTYSGDAVGKVTVTNDDGTTSIVSQSPFHSMTSWIHETDNSSDTPDAFTCKMVIKADTDAYTENTNGKVYLAYSDKLGANHVMNITGNVVFEDVTIVGVRSSLDRTINFRGNDVTFESSCTFGYTNVSYYDNPGTVWDRTVTARNGLATQLISDNASGTFGGMNVTFNNAYRRGWNEYTYFVSQASGASKTITFNDDVNITFNNASAAPSVKWGVASSDTSLAFENLNIKVKAGTMHNAANNSGTVTANAVQLIAEQGATVNGFVTTLTALGITNYYYLTNTTAHKDVLDFTSTGGVFKVADGYVVTATNTTTGETVVSDGSRLKLTTPGAYTYSLNVVRDYYVQNPGVAALDSGAYDDDTQIHGSGTKEDPAATVLDVIKIINDDGLGVGDFANVYIMQRSDWNEYDGTAVGKISSSEWNVPHHNMTAWAHSETRNDEKSPESHEWTLVLKGDTSTTTDGGKVYLTYGDRLGTNHAMNLGGPTVFENVTVVMMRRSLDRTIKFNNHNVTFESSATYGYTDLDYNDSGRDVWNGTVTKYNSLAHQLIADSASATFDGMTVNMNNAYSTGYNAKFYVVAPSSGDNKTVTFTNDVNININNASANPMMVFGVSVATSKLAFNNLNIHVKAGKIGTSAVTTGTTTANAVQVILENGTTATNLETTISSLGIENYYILNNTGDNGLLGFNLDSSGNSVAGKFTVAGDVTAVAANSEGTIVAVSDDGVLDLSGKPGVYEIRFVEQYDADGSTITIYEPGTIDLSGIEHDEIDGKVFVGWAFSDGTYPAQVDDYVYGVVLTAQYVDYTTADFKTEEVQMRDDGNNGDPSLRFIQSMKKGVLPNITEQGTLMLPLSQSYGYEMYIDEPIVLTYTANKTVATFDVATTGATPEKIVGTNILCETDDTLKYTLCLTGITKENYTTSYAVRGYIKFTDNNGFDSIFYAEQEVSNLYKVAAESTEQTATEKAIVEYVEGERVENYWLENGLTADGKITAETTAQYIDAGCGCYGTDTCDHKLFTLNDGKLYVRDVVLDTGLDVEETQIGFITDTHFSNINQMDIDENSVALASYRGRPESWREHQQKYFTHGINEFVSMFQKTVNGGDVMDYLSWAAVQTADRLLTKQSVNNRNMKKLVTDASGVTSLQDIVSGSMSMVLGNHDPKQLSSTGSIDSTLEESRTLEERYAMVDPHWTNDLYYDSEIMLDSNGNANVMMIYLDNNLGKYWESQIAPLTRDLAYAKQNGIPVLIFQHIQMLTMNPDETEFKYIDGFSNFNKVAPQSDEYYDITTDDNGKLVYTIKDGYIGEKTKVNVYDMTSSTSFLGNKNDDEATMTVCNLIRQNADIVKGVFAGHIHANTVTHIIGIDENGEANGLTIPQYTGYLASQRGVMRITVK